MRALRAHVTDIDDPTRRDFALDGHVPLLRAGRKEVKRSLQRDQVFAVSTEDGSLRGIHRRKPCVVVDESLEHAELWHKRGADDSGRRKHGKCWKIAEAAGR